MEHALEEVPVVRTVKVEVVRISPAQRREAGLRLLREANVRVYVNMRGTPAPARDR